MQYSDTFTFKNICALLRSKYNVTQTRMATQLKVTKQYLSFVEHGKKKITNKVAVGYVQFFRGIGISDDEMQILGSTIKHEYADLDISMLSSEDKLKIIDFRDSLIKN